MDDLLREFMKIWWHIPAIMVMVFVYAFLLNWALFKPVQKILKDREERKQESEALSQRSREQLKSRFDEYEQAVLEAHRKATHIKEEARSAAYDQRSTMLSQVKAEAAAEMAKNDEVLKKDVDDVKADIQAQMPEFARGIVAKILGREVAV